MTYDFFHSFTKDYSGVGNIYKDEKVLDVWVARGRDWVDIIKQMIDEDFTPNTGIKVNVNVIPANQMQVLLLANTAVSHQTLHLASKAKCRSIMPSVTDLSICRISQTTRTLRPGSGLERYSVSV